MIKRLNHSKEMMANQIFTVFQHSYKVEAQLINAANFPPLLRSAQDIAKSKSQFYGFYVHDSLAAVVELVIENNRLDIHSLTVDPTFFRKGIANKLLNFILSEFTFTKAIVETAVKNKPAINLYKKHGFIEFKKWTPAHGIRKIAMSIDFT